MRVAVEIGGRKFVQKSQAALYFRQILKETEAGSFLTGETEAFMRDALTRHYAYSDRFQGKAFCIGVEYAPVSRERSKRFFVQYVDGTCEAFSWQKCLTNETHESRVRQALRGTIAPQIRAALEEAFLHYETIPCGITGKEITRQDACVDHAFPRTFSALVAKWLDRRSLSLDRIPVAPAQDEIYQWQLQDKAMERDWSEFHWRWSNLRIADSRANSLLSNKPETTLHELP